MDDEGKNTIDQEARDIATSAFFAWGNLVGTIVDTMAAAELPEHLIHDFLDRLGESNNAVLREPYRDGYQKMLRVLRETATNTQ